MGKQYIYLKCNILDFFTNVYKTVSFYDLFKFMTKFTFSMYVLCIIVCNIMY